MSINLEPPYGRPLPEDELDINALRARIAAPGKPKSRKSNDLINEFDNHGDVRGFYSDVEGPLSGLLALGADIVIRHREAHPIGEKIIHREKEALIDEYSYDFDSGRMKVRIQLLGSSKRGGEFTWIFADEL